MNIRMFFLLTTLCFIPLAETAKASFADLFGGNSSADQKIEYLQELALSPGLTPLNTLAFQALKENDFEAIYDLAYATKGFSQQMPADKELGAKILQPLIAQGDDFAEKLNDFIKKRSLEKAGVLLQKADSPRQRSLAFMCLAEANYAQKKYPKTMMYSVLSLATYPSEIHDQQFQFYLNNLVGTPISLLQTREALLENLRDAMDKQKKPEKFRLLFDVSTFVGLLSDYPLRFSAEEETDPVQICLVFDENYVKHAGVTILSAILSAKPGSRYNFNVLQDHQKPISERSKEIIKGLLTTLGDDRFQINFSIIEDHLLPAQLSDLKINWPRNVYFKMLIPKLFSQYDRVLYMDTDLIVRGDLNGLYHQNMDEKLILGTRDICAAKNLVRMAMSFDNCYLNGGVVLFNIDQFKKEGKTDILMSAFAKNPDLIYMLDYNEQDLMALLFKGKIAEISFQQIMAQSDEEPSGEWNWYAQKEHPSSHWSRVNSHFAQIIHMEGGDMKPWFGSRRYMRWRNDPKSSNGIQSIYWALRDASPWPTQK